MPRATPADVDAICAALPGAEKGTSWGDRPTWFATGNKKPSSFLIHRKPQKNVADPATGEPYPDLLVISVPDAAAKAALVEGDGPFFTIAHFDGYPAVLVKLERIERDQLVEVVTDAWLDRLPKTTASRWLADHADTEA